MSRKTDWPRRLKKALTSHVRMPFEYGKSDCFMICSDVVKAMTGKAPYPKALGYKTEAGAAKKLKQHGFETVEDAWRAKYEEIHPFQIGRGDIAIVQTEAGIAGAVFDGKHLFTKGPESNTFLPVTHAKTAFRVI